MYSFEIIISVDVLDRTGVQPRSQAVRKKRTGNEAKTYQAAIVESGYKYRMQVSLPVLKTALMGI